MIRRAPCELYIKFLLIHPHGFSHDAVRNSLHAMGLDFPGTAYLERLEQTLSVPKPFQPGDQKHFGSQRFLMKHRLTQFFHPDDASRLAHDLVKNARAKELIETMTLTDEPLAVVAHVVRSRGTRCTVEALQRYCAFYWDLSLVDSVEINALLRMRSEHLVYRDDGIEVKNHDRLQAAALGKAAYKDPRRLVTEMPITPMAGLLNRMRMGFMPSSVDLSRLADATRKAATVRAFDATMSGHPNAAASARDFAVVAKVMTDLINDIGNPDQEIQKELQQLALHTEDRKPPTIHQLSAGNHTLDIQPMVVEVEAPAEAPEDSNE